MLSTFSKSVFRERALMMLVIPCLLSSCAGVEPINGGSVDFEAKGGGRYKVGSPYQVKGRWYHPVVDYGYEETGIASWYGPGFHGKQTANGEVYDQNAMTAAHRTLPMPSFVLVTNLENGRSVVLRVNDRGPFAHSRIIDVSRRAAELLGFRTAGTTKVRVTILSDESRKIAKLAADDNGQVPPGEMPPGVKQEASLINNSSDARPLTSERAVPVEKLEVTLLDDSPAPPGSPLADNDPDNGLRPFAPSVTPQNANAVDNLVGQGDIFVQAGAFSQIHNAYRLQARLSSLGPTNVSETKVGADILYRVRIGPLESVKESDQIIKHILGNDFGDARVIIE